MAWEAQGKRRFLRVEHRRPRPSGRQWLAYPLINLRQFFGTYTCNQLIEKPDKHNPQRPTLLFRCSPAEDIRWAYPADLPTFDFLEGDAELITLLSQGQLPVLQSQA